MVALGTRKLILEVDGTDYSDSVSEVRIVSGESDADFVSFQEARSGGARMYTLAMTLKQDMDAAALWNMAWADAGQEVAVEVWPNGGTVASATTPKFTGSVIITEPDGDFLGGEADRSSKKFFTSEFEWEFTAKPVKAIA